MCGKTLWSVLTLGMFCNISSNLWCMFGCFVITKRYPPPPAPARQQPNGEKY